MPLPIPVLDDLTWEELVEDGRERIPSTAPGWTDHNAHDPGITLLELAGVGGRAGLLPHRPRPSRPPGGVPGPPRRAARAGHGLDCGPARDDGIGSATGPRGMAAGRRGGGGAVRLRGRRTAAGPRRRWSASSSSASPETAGSPRPWGPSPSRPSVRTARRSSACCWRRRRAAAAWCCGSRSRTATQPQRPATSPSSLAWECSDGTALAVASRGGRSTTTPVGCAGRGRSRSTCRPVAPCGCAAGSRRVATTGLPCCAACGATRSWPGR